MLALINGLRMTSHKSYNNYTDVDGSDRTRDKFLQQLICCKIKTHIIIILFSIKKSNK